MTVLKICTRMDELFIITQVGSNAFSRMIEWIMIFSYNGMLYGITLQMPTTMWMSLTNVIILEH